MKLIKFFAPWCEPCSAMSAVLHCVNHPLIKTMADISIDTADGLELAKRYNVRSIPAMIITEDNGQEIRRLIGNKQKADILEFLA